MHDQPPTLNRALQLMEQHLQNLKEEGVKEIEITRTASAAASRAQPAAAARTAAATAPRATHSAAAAPVSLRPAAPARLARGPLLPRPQQPDDADPELVALAREISACEKCGLCKTRSRTVPGQGNPRPEIMFIGEGPGSDEDQQGLAFIGRAGQLLTRMISAMGFSREDLFIGNIVKCRPTEDNAGRKDRPPTPEEMAACIPYLHRQIAILKPRVIVALGATAVKGLFGDDLPGITKLRGSWMTFDGIDVMPTLHPSYVLRKGGDHGEGDREVFLQVWSDLTAALKKIGRTPPPKKK